MRNENLSGNVRVKRNRIRVLLALVGLLGAAGMVEGQVTLAGTRTLDFEPPLPSGLSPVTLFQGTAVPVSGRITTQYSNQGVTMSGVALIDGGVGHAASGQYMLGGLSTANTVDYWAPLTFDFVDPSDSRSPALADYFSVTTDRVNDTPNIITLTAYNAQGSVVGSVSQTDTGNMTIRLQGIGKFKRVVVQSRLVSGGFGGVGFDLVTYGSATSTMLLPQFCFGGGWYSGLYFTNTTDSASSITITFVNENGTPMFVPSANGSSINLSIAPRGTAVFEAPNVGSLSQGYASVALPTGVVGYGVFRATVPGRDDQEAVVPLSSTDSASATLIWDDTRFVTALAVANANGQTNFITVTARDESGAVVGVSSLNLLGRNKTALTLRDLPGLAGITGKRGSAEIRGSATGLGVLGLRFGGAAFTSIPAVQ